MVQGFKALVQEVNKLEVVTAKLATYGSFTKEMFYVISFLFFPPFLAFLSITITKLLLIQLFKYFSIICWYYITLYFKNSCVLYKQCKNTPEMITTRIKSKDNATTIIKVYFIQKSFISTIFFLDKEICFDILNTNPVSSCYNISIENKIRTSQRHL